MARLTNDQYLRNHGLLLTGKNAADSAFVLLSATEQWDLFQYYLPHRSHTPADLLAHRRQVSLLDPSLPQRAGRAFSRWRRIRESLPGYREYAAGRSRMKKNAKKQVVVFSEVHPELNAARVARIIVNAASERMLSVPAVGVAEADAAFSEPRLYGAGTEAESFTDASK